MAAPASAKRVPHWEHCTCLPGGKGRVVRRLALQVGHPTLATRMVSPLWLGGDEGCEACSFHVSIPPAFERTQAKSHRGATGKRAGRVCGRGASRRARHPCQKT